MVPVPELTILPVIVKLSNASIVKSPLTFIASSVSESASFIETFPPETTETVPPKAFPTFVSAIAFIPAVKRVVPVIEIALLFSC